MTPISRLDAFLGNSCEWNNIDFCSPTIREISSIGESVYYSHLILASFDKERILLDLFNFDKDKYETMKNEDDFDVLVSHPTIVQYICDSLSFFINKPVNFDTHTFCFIVDNQPLCNKDNYMELSSVIKMLNGSDSEKKKETKFSSSKAKELLEKRNAMLKKINKNSDDNLDLKDVLSILCVAEGNGINVFNVKELTIYQVYEHLERMSLKDSFNRILPVWANGHLGEKGQMPEWIKKTKL
ncbi:hypothetical protein [Paenibacillus donghaensis]|uniref:Uncharacterized protein n=1 Tax=Paenibacillus donghaensis TaxID=414771 RepID=A0A2Z2KNV7_9BACL|nr:hypothetical protein [Paenibacillus donghaensis]ASA21821.1 hypothetical protein B9T62_14185 [Paenibacillus donghaensis]